MKTSWEGSRRLGISGVRLLRAELRRKSCGLDCLGEVRVYLGKVLAGGEVRL